MTAMNNFVSYEHLSNKENLESDDIECSGAEIRLNEGGHLSSTERRDFRGWRGSLLWCSSVMGMSLLIVISIQVLQGGDYYCWNRFNYYCQFSAEYFFNSYGKER